MEVGGAVLDSPERKGLDGTVGRCEPSMDHAGFEKALGLEVMHEVVGVKGGGVARRAFALAEEHSLPAQLGLAGLFGIEFAVPAQLGSRRKVQDGLELAHEVGLRSSFDNVDALFRGDHRISIEVGGSLFELRKILYGFQGPLRAEQSLDVDSPERGSIETMSVGLWPHISHKMGRPIAVAVCMTIKAAHPQARSCASPVEGGIELLLRKGGDQEPESFQLLGVQNSGKEFEIVIGRDELPLGYVAQIGPSSEIDRRRKLRKKTTGHNIVEVETSQIPAGLLFDFVDVVLGEEHATFGVIGMGEGEEAFRPETFFTDFRRAHGCQVFPSNPLRELDPDPRLDLFSPRHSDLCFRPVGEVIALF